MKVCQEIEYLTYFSCGIHLYNTPCISVANPTLDAWDTYN